MPLLNIVVTLIIVGIGLYLINRFVPMASSLKSILNISLLWWSASGYSKSPDYGDR